MASLAGTFGVVMGGSVMFATAVSAVASLDELIERLGLDPAVATWLGPAVLLIVPALLVIGLVLRRTAEPAVRPVPAVGGDEDQTTRHRPAGGSQAAARTAGGQMVDLHGLEDATVVVETDGSEAGETTFRFTRNTMLARIGREEDNEIRLMHPTVHRYHAMIRRDLAEGYEIADLSDEAGNGVLVNGERVAHRRLQHGDVIALGAARLLFKGAT